MNRNTSRAPEVWARFVGIFGGDAVRRKFGDTPPAEWVAMLDKLQGFELDRGMRRLVYSGRAHVPTLPEFLKLCRTIGGDENLDEPQAPALPAPDAWKGDEWDEIASQHLLAYLMREMLAKPGKYGKPATYMVLRAMDAKDFKRNPNANASPEFIRAVGILVSYKHAWARDMREGNVNLETGEIERPSLKSQKAAWEDCMDRAESAIAQKAAA